MEIKHRLNNKVLFELETDSLKMCLEIAIKANAYLGGANLRGAYLRKAYLGSAHLRRADLGGANLRGAYLGGANLRGANLKGANLRGAYLGRADLGGAYLGGANLRGANLRRANLRGVNLRGAHLERADLGGAYLGRADLGGAYLGGAKNYRNNHDVFIEIVKRQRIDFFTDTEWSIIGKIIIKRFCWDEIRKFGKDASNGLKKIAELGFNEYLEKFKEKEKK